MKDKIKEYKIKVNITELDKLTDGDMKKELIALSTSSFWLVIMKYVNARLDKVDEFLQSVNPIDNAYQMSLYQGVRSGLLDLPGAMEGLKEEIKEGAKKAKAKKVDM